MPTRDPHPPLDLFRHKVEDMMDEGVGFAEIERSIEALEFAPDDKAALWLLAWSLEAPNSNEAASGRSCGSSPPIHVSTLEVQSAMNETRPAEERAEVGPFAIGTRQRRSFERPPDDRYGDRIARVRAHPLEFDESGFPLPQHEHSMVDRVRRLLRV